MALPGLRLLNHPFPQSGYLGEDGAVPTVDENDSPATNSALPDQPPMWYRQLWLTAGVLAVSLVLLIVGAVTLIQAGSVDSDADLFLADAAADSSRVAGLESEIQTTQSQLDDAGEEQIAIEVQLVALLFQTDALRGSADDADSQTAVAARSLEAAGTDAIALHQTMQDLLAALDNIVAAETAAAEEFLAGVEAGNQRQIDAMNRLLGAGAGDLQAVVDGEEANLLALRLMLFEAGGTTSDGILAAEAFDDPQSGWTVFDNADGTAGYVDDGYQIVAGNASTVIGFMPTEVASIGIEVDADVREAGEAGDFEYGIVCRAQETTSATEGYLLSVGATHVRIGAFDTRGDYRELTPWEDILAPTSGSRRLGAVCDGNRIELFVDGELVADTIAIGLDGAAIGLFAVAYGAEPVTVQFDDLRLVHPSVVGGDDGD